MYICWLSVECLYYEGRSILDKENKTCVSQQKYKCQAKSVLSATRNNTQQNKQQWLLIQISRFPALSNI